MASRLRTALLSFWKWAHWALPAVAGVVIAATHHDLLGPVVNNGGDNVYHLLSEYALAHALNAGDNLFGPLAVDVGLPVLRFYQALFYLKAVAIHSLTGLDMRFVHNLMVTICFSLSPLSYCYFLRALGLRRFAAGTGALVAAISVGSFGNSFEAYHGIGIATQSMGAFFFPLFLGSFICMLRGNNRWSSTSLLFAAAFLSHAMMAIYAVCAGVLYYLVAPVRIRASAVRLTLFVIFGALLVAFWVFPFIEHTMEMRAVPDSVVRGQAKRWWFTSVSRDEMVALAASGRLLDDPRVAHGAQTDPLDKLMDKVSIGGTRRTRPPIVTALMALGMIVAIMGIRRTSNRFLLSGLAFSLVLFAGPDDYPWLRHLPFMKIIQTFRCTYLIELFAFGLCGVGLEAVARHGWRVVAGRGSRARVILGAIFITGSVAGVAACCAEIVVLSQRHIRVHPQAALDSMTDAHSSLDENGYPFQVLCRQRWGSYKSWLIAMGYRSPCSHWGGVGPTTSFQFCVATSKSPEKIDMLALSGVRFVSGKAGNVKKYLEARDADGVPIYQRLPNGKDRKKKSNAGHFLLDSGRDSFLRPLRGEPLPVVCSDAQWTWIVKGWVSRFHQNLRDKNCLVPMRVAAGSLEESGLTSRSSKVLYVDGRKLSNDRKALADFSAGGGLVVSTFDIEGVGTVRPGSSSLFWSALTGKAHGKIKARDRTYREDDDPGIEVANIEMKPSPRHSAQRYTFEIDALEDVVAILPTKAVPGWNAHLDGVALPVFPAGPDMVGVIVPQGAHDLSFEWRMPGRHVALLFSSIAAAVIALFVWLLSVAGVFARFRRRTA